jgi:hypothetical protein
MVYPFPSPSKCVKVFERETLGLDFGARKSGLKVEDPAGGRILISGFLLS